MASCSGVTVKSISGGKVKLKGTITGLDKSKHYCLHYFSGGWRNLPNSYYDYTYFGNRTSYDLSAAGCYVPTSDLDEGKQFEVRCHEVSGTCENRVAEACSKILYYKVTETRLVTYRVLDEDRNPVSGVRIECGGELFYTGSDGRVENELETGTTYYASCYAPDGYECVDCYERFYHDSDRMIDFKLKKKASEQCHADIHVIDQEGNGVSNVGVMIPGAIGTDTIITGTDGTASGFNLISGKEYTAYITTLPSGWDVAPSGGNLTFTPRYDATYTLHVKKKAEPVVCTEGEKRSPETCWNGSVIYKEVCRDNRWASTGEKCPTRPPAPECKEGDKKAGYVCSGGKWVPVSTPPSPGPEVPPAPPVTCTEGAYNAEGTMICRGGTWVPVSAPPPECTEGAYNAEGTMICRGGTWVPVSAPPGPGVTPKYLTISEADEMVRMGLPCYIKCTLPVLYMLPGIPYTPGAWIPPFCAITTEQ